ncbi:D-alanyl-D-alanine carboxypeptidase/D-alanyl-D-alanine-endopeptidase [Streptomyces sp. NBC_01317]|uniref:D-alanyl-D-alanine carboxypeptidase/D-alanyl-D-alanine endopeptidase n=1 Tax=Streptomyces sp. NBC_01317 TaxID=2903822 RepID=UPI002E1447D6|nr:D-alanyl-D-alanine carboxypeptidase/D-alanyl-D-alanine-endopeptidase [Streptomyces sp. NBC_01317]
MLEPKVWQLTAGSVAVGLVLAAGAVSLAGPWDSGQRKAERRWAAAQDRTGGADHGPPAAHGPARQPAPAPSAPAVLAALGGAAPAAARLPAGLAEKLGKKLGPLLDDPALGTVRTADVIDVATGRRLYGRSPDTPMVPASTVKIATMVAALSALGPEHRIPTTVVAGRDARKLTLVGGGDASLDTRRLGALADDTARALGDRGIAAVEIGYDVSLYSGPREHPIGPNDNIAPVVALMADEGRLDHSTSGPAPRSGDPAGDAADVFAGLLRDRGVRITDTTGPHRAPKGAKPLARTYSAPLSALVERTLTESDNDLAESLARQTALAEDEPASFAGAGRAVTEQIEELELPLGHARFTDGSGLSRKDRVGASLLTALLARAADPDHPELRPVLTGLPVAGFSGTLRGRYEGDVPARGLVRAKTGTLTGVNTLAGTVVDTGGRLLAFAFLAGATPAPDPAQTALDRLSAALGPR